MRIRPFEANPDSEYIGRVSNHLFDYVMPMIGANAWKVLCFIFRKTRGWGKEADDLSLSEIQTGTGIKSEHTIIDATGRLEEAGYIKVIHNNRKINRYALNITFEIEVDDPPKPEETESETTAKNTPVNAQTTAKNAVVDSETGQPTTAKNTADNKNYCKKCSSTTAKITVDGPQTTAKNADTKGSSGGSSCINSGLDKKVIEIQKHFKVFHVEFSEDTIRALSMDIGRYGYDKTVLAYEKAIKKPADNIVQYAGYLLENGLIDLNPKPPAKRDGAKNGRGHQDARHTQGKAGRVGGGTGQREGDPNRPGIVPDEVIAAKVARIQRERELAVSSLRADGEPIPG